MAPFRSSRCNAFLDRLDSLDRAISRVDDKVRELTAMRRALARLRVACNEGSPTNECPILEALEDET